MSDVTVNRAWETVLDVDGPPIEADPGTFFDLADFFTTLKQDTELVADAFTGIVNDANADFQGESAEAFATMVGDLGSTLALVPKTAEEAAGFLRSHGTELETLRIEAQAALGRANTRYGDVQQAKINLDTAKAGRNRLQTQSDNFDATVCGDDSHRIQVELDLEQARGGVRLAEQALADAEGTLARSQTEYDGLVEDYRVLDSRTCTELDNIALGDLSDPSWWEQVWDGVAGFITTVASDIVMGAINLFSGDWEQFLWGLSDLLGGILTVLTIVALFTPIGPLVILGLAVVKFAVDAYLYHEGSTNPRTGEQITLVDLGFTALTGLAAFAAWSTTPSAGAASTATAGRWDGALRAVVQAPGGGPGQLSTITTRVTTGARTASEQYRTATSVSSAYAQSSATVARTAVAVAPEVLQVASTAQTVGGTSYDIHQHATPSPWQAHADTVSPATASSPDMAPASPVGPIAPPLNSQVDSLDAADASPASLPDGYGVVVVAPADGG